MDDDEFEVTRLAEHLVWRAECARSKRRHLARDRDRSAKISEKDSELRGEAERLKPVAIELAASLGLIFDPEMHSLYRDASTEVPDYLRYVRLQPEIDPSGEGDEAIAYAYSQLRASRMSPEHKRLMETLAEIEMADVMREALRKMEPI
ncbi:MAG: hypothetical protein JNJ45_11075 [Chthonomonas sp.]|nr:hypothetical protein [Chthonomonas sp.]